MTHLEFKVLGPLEVDLDGRPVPLTPKAAALLATLLLQANQVVSVDRLVEHIWGELAPDAARNGVQGLVRRLRLSLQPSAEADVLLTRPPGYLLRVEPGHLDLHRFEMLAAEAKQAIAEGRLEEAVSCQRAALVLWRGPALAGVASAGLQRVEVPRLEERRLQVLEERIATELQLGWHAEVVGELVALVAEHPLREQLHGQLMVALYRSGRQADALEVYRRLRQVLTEELGLEPCPSLQRLQRDILTSDPSLVLPHGPDRTATTTRSAVARPPAPDAPSLSSGRTPVSPCQLPPGVASFTGREREVGWLVESLSRAAVADEPVAIVAVDGPAGVGKSTLACHVAHRVLGQFPDGQLYVNLHGATASVAPLEPAEVLGRFLRAFGVSGQGIPEQLDERAGLLRSLLSSRRVLVVLDNAENAAQVRPLLPARPGCAALVTSRERMTQLDGAACLYLNVLDPVESMTLLGQLAGVERVTAEPQAAAKVAELCGYLPLALRIVGARLAARPTWPVQNMAERLASEHARLDELQLGGFAVRASLQLSYQALRSKEEAQSVRLASAFRLLGLLNGADVGVPVVAAILEQSIAATELALERLVDAQLLQSRAAGRYQFHDLVRLFARERAADEDPEPERTAAMMRALRCYLATTRKADHLLRPRQATAADQLTEAVDVPAFANQAAAMAWLEAERANLVAAVAQAAVGVAPGVAGQLAASLFGFFDIRGYWDDWERVNQLALQAARACQDVRGEAQAWRDLGAVAWRRFRLDEATSHLQRSLELRRRLGDRHGEAQTLNNLGLVLIAGRRYQDATSRFERSLALYREQRDRLGEGKVLNNLAEIHRLQRRFQHAVTCLHGDLAICRELGDRRGEAISLYNLGEVYRDMGHGDEASAYHQESLAICQQLGDRRGEGRNLDGLGDARRLQGRYDEAVACSQQGLTLLREVGDRYSEANTLWHLGLTVNACGDRGEARRRWRQALTIYEQLRAPEAAEVRAALDQPPVDVIKAQAE
jgi:DNA-binding SARP family transcriptional activator/tetratricopeptide (TPR) repeat protein